MRHHFVRLLLGWSFTALVLSCLGALSPLWAKQVLPRAGGEQQINVQTFGDQTSPGIAADSQGNYAVAWIGPDDAFRYHLYVRLFTALGEARTGEIVVDGAAPPFENPGTPRLAMAPNGRFVVLWSAQHAWARLYDSQGVPLGERFRTDDAALLSGTAADLAMGDDGRFLVVWNGAGGSPSIYVRSFSAGGQPLEAGHRVDAAAPGSVHPPRVVAMRDGGFVVTWVRERVPDFFRRDDLLVAVRRASVSGSWSQEIKLNGLTDRGLSTAAPVAHPNGGFSVVWGSSSYNLPPSLTEGPELRARRFDDLGASQGPEVALPFARGFHGAPAVASDAFGNSLVIAAYGFGSKPDGRLFGHDWRQVGEIIPIVTFEDDLQFDPVATSTGESFVAAWTGGTYPPIFFPFSGPFGQDGYGFGIFAQAFAPPLCVEGSKILCLGTDGRFELSVDWKTSFNTEGSGRAHPLTGDTGAFWFFDPDNLELLTKVLDGLEINGHFWVFSGGISDVDYTLEVLDSLTGERRNYHNTQGQLISRADTEAFTGYEGTPLCVVSAGQSAEIESGSRDAVASTAPLSPVPSCPPANPESLCFQIDSTFQVGVEFVDPRSGLHGVGQALPLTGNSGAFSFFDASNLELIVKVLDGRAVNGKFWFFFGGLSDVDYTITVRNLATQAVRTYTNSHGQLQSRADTQAFGF